MSGFLTALNKGDARTENGAAADSSTGDIFLDDFGQAGTFRNRSMSEIDATMSPLWNSNPLLTLQSAFYFRMVTRKVKFKGTSTEKVQKGAGLKDEFLKRYLWIHGASKDVFYKNLWLIPAVGSWRDMWQLMFYAETHGIEIEREKLFAVMVLAHTDDLFLKYMPLEKAKSKLASDRSKAMNKFAREFRSYLGASPREMRKMKSDGKGHIWQQLISRKNFKSIDWNTIPGKALAILTSGEFMTNHGLVKSYEAWLDTQPIAKFTGYPYELFKDLREAKHTGMGITNYKKKTIDKQFEGLLEKARKDQGGFKENVWTAIDTSGSMSMSSYALDDGTLPLDMCLSLGIYFSSLNEGAFKDHVIMFDAKSRTKKLTGTATDKYKQLTDASTAWGNTNFQSVIDEVVRIRKTNPHIPIEEYPTTLLVVSDMQFDPVNGSMWSQKAPTKAQSDSNHAIAMAKLKAVGLPDVKVVWWQVRNGGVSNFPSGITDPGTYHFSGFDGSILTMLLGQEPVINDKGERVQPSALEVMHAAYTQEILEQTSL